jgi:hypothetical protein
MYSPIDGIPAPAGARAWRSVYAAPLLPWDVDYLRKTTDAREDIKRRFSTAVLDTR